VIIVNPRSMLWQDGLFVLLAFFKNIFYTHACAQPFNSSLSGTTRVGRYQKKRLPTHTHFDYQTSFYQLPPSAATHSILLVQQSFSTRPQPLSRTSLAYLLVWNPLPHTPYISSPNHYLLFAKHAHTIATCFVVVPRLCRVFLISGRPLPEETFTYSHPSWSSDILYRLPPFTTIHSILFIQFACLTVLFDNLSHSTCPYHRSLFSCNTIAMSSIPNLSLSLLLYLSFFNLTPHTHLTILISACWSATTFSHTTILYNLPLIISDIGLCLLVSNGTNCRNLFHTSRKHIFIQLILK